MNERIRFPKGKQRSFIREVMEITSCPSLRELAKRTDISYSTFRKYYCESLFLPKIQLDKLCFISNINSNNLEFEVLEPNWGSIKGGKIGIKIMREKYKHKLLSWSLKAGKKLRSFNLKKINYPPLNEDLAEFIGVYLGDGTMTKYFVRIAGDKRYDFPYFNYLSGLIFGLFGLRPVITDYGRKDINTFYLVIHSKEVSSFLTNNFYLKPGNKIKNKSRIPKKILYDKNFTLSCLRGLIDTDGSVSRRGRKGSQFCINFTSHNEDLLRQVEVIGKSNNFFSYATKFNVGTNSWENILRYFKIVGSSNLRHIVRFNERVHRNIIYQKDVLKYYQKPFYTNLSLPFKLKTL